MYNVLNIWQNAKGIIMTGNPYTIRLFYEKPTLLNFS